MNHSSPLVRLTARAYGAALRLYPARFRFDFGPYMRDTFERWLVDEASSRGLEGILAIWWITVGELLPTAVREHAALLAQSVAPTLKRIPVGGVLRTGVASLLPLAVYVLLLRVTGTISEALGVSIWFGVMAGGLVRARGRGWACHRDGVMGSALGAAIPLAWSALTEYSSPGIYTVAPVVLSVAATAGLIVSVYVRLSIEGVSLGSCVGKTPEAQPC